MKSNQLVVVFFLLVAIVLTGCISKRVEVIPEEVIVLTDENSKVVTDDKNSFSLRIPNEAEFVINKEEAGARLFRIDVADIQPPTQMYVEENSMTLDDAIGLLLGEEVFKEISREDVTINGYQGKKITAQVSTIPGEFPYYFLNANGRTFVFSLRVGQNWEYYQSVVNSFSLVDPADDSADEGIEGGDEPAELDAES